MRDELAHFLPEGCFLDRVAEVHDAFTIGDAYHCSMLSSTDPNRYYLYTGYAGNDGKGGGPVIFGFDIGK